MKREAVGESKMTVYLRPEIEAALRQAAEERGLTLMAFIRTLLTGWYRQRRPIAEPAQPQERAGQVA